MENPAVLADTLWKNAPSQEISSVAFKSSVPAMISTMLVEMTTLEWKDSFLKHLFFAMSRMTRKPRPPNMISPAVVRFRRTLSW